MCKLRHLFLRISLLFIVKSITAMETLPKEDFTSFFNKGFSEFIEQFGKEKKAELGIEDWVEKQRVEEEQKQAEVEHLLRETKKQAKEEARKLAEQYSTIINRHKEESSELEKFKHIGCMELSELADIMYEIREGIKAWSALKEAARSQVLTYMEHPTTQPSHRATSYLDWYHSRQHLTDKAVEELCISGHAKIQPLLAAIKTLRNREVAILNDMVKYHELTKMPHPRWDEFSKM